MGWSSRVFWGGIDECCWGHIEQDRRRRGGKPPPGPRPPLQTKVTIAGKSKMYHWENLVRPFLGHKLLGPKPPFPPFSCFPAPPLPLSQPLLSPPLRLPPASAQALSPSATFWYSLCKRPTPLFSRGCTCPPSQTSALPTSCRPGRSIGSAQASRSLRCMWTSSRGLSSSPRTCPPSPPWCTRFCGLLSSSPPPVIAHGHGPRTVQTPPCLWWGLEALHRGRTCHLPSAKATNDASRARVLHNKGSISACRRMSLLLESSVRAFISMACV